MEETFLTAVDLLVRQRVSVPPVALLELLELGRVLHQGLTVELPILCEQGRAHSQDVTSLQGLHLAVSEHMGHTSKGLHIALDRLRCMTAPFGPKEESGEGPRGA